MRALLDVNVLIALLDANHIHHGRAREWLEANISEGWASCVSTQHGCIRILSSANYPNALKPMDVASRLRDATSQVFHQFWAQGPGLLSPGLMHWEYLVSSRQVTDAYLLALAVQHGGRFITFDRGLAWSVVPNAEAQHLVVL